MKSKSARIKLLMITLSLCAVLIIVYFVRTLFFVPAEDVPKSGEERYFPVDTSEDIFQNPIYRTLDRSVAFSSDGIEQSFDIDTDIDSAVPECRFFLEYFRTLIYGEYEKITDFYVKDFFETPPHFTAQMIHDIRVSHHSNQEMVLDGKTQTVFNFYVQYRIYRNNGTFRQGVFNDSAVPQIYQLILDENQNLRIVRILDIEIKN